MKITTSSAMESFTLTSGDLAITADKAYMICGIIKDKSGLAVIDLSLSQVIDFCESDSFVATSIADEQIIKVVRNTDANLVLP